MDNLNLKNWLATPLGAYVAQRELAYFDEVVADIFGFNALQFGMTEYDFLRTSRMQLKFSAGTEDGADIRAAGDAQKVIFGHAELQGIKTKNIRYHLIEIGELTLRDVGAKRGCEPLF